MTALTGDDSALPVGPPLRNPGPAERPRRRRLEGRHVFLTPLEPQRDIDALYACSHGDPVREQLWTYMPYGPFAARAQMLEWLTQIRRHRDPLFFTVRRATEDTPSGMMSFLRITPAQRVIEIGHIWYSPETQRTETNTEAVYLLLREAFERLNYRRVEWKCDALNARSRAAATRLGFSFEGVFRQHMIVKGRNRDSAWFAMLDREWPSIRANFEHWLAADSVGRPSLTRLNAPLVRPDAGGCRG